MKNTLHFKFIITILLLAFTLNSRANCQQGVTITMAPACASALPITVHGAENAVSISIFNSYGLKVATGDATDTILNSAIPPASIYYAGTYYAIVDFGNNCIDTTAGLTLQPDIINTVSISTPHDTICTNGANVTFTANAQGGATPIYQWVVNGVYVGGNTATYTGNFNNADLVYCYNTSTAACVQNVVAASNLIRLTVGGGAVSATPNPVCADKTVMLNNAAQAQNITWLNNTTAVSFNQASSPAVIDRAGSAQQSGDSMNTFSASDYAVDSLGNLYVPDYNGNRVLFFPAGSGPNTNGIVVAGGNGTGGNANQLNHPTYICVDDSANIYVQDLTVSGYARIVRFPAHGNSNTNATVVISFANTGTYPAGMWVSNGLLYVRATDQISNDDILLIPTLAVNWPNATGFDPIITGKPILAPNNNYYMVNTLHNEIDQLTQYDIQNGNPASTWAAGNGQGNAGNELNTPADIAADAASNIYVWDKGNNRIQMFPAGSTTSTYATTIATIPANLSLNGGLRLDGQNNIYFNAEDIYSTRSYIVEIKPGQTTIDTSYTNPVPGNYTVTVYPTGACPAKTTTLRVDSVPLGFINHTMCYGETFTVLGHTFDSTAFFIDTLSSTALDGCDSVVYINVGADINPLLTPSIAQYGDTLQAFGAHYQSAQWYYNGTPLTDTTNTIIAQANGTYTVTFTSSNGCTSRVGTSDILLGINNTPRLLAGIYPNPGNGTFILQTTQVQGAAYSIYNQLGQCIQTGMVTGNSQTISLTNAANGIYTIMLTNNNLTASARFAVAK